MTFHGKTKDRGVYESPSGEYLTIEVAEREGLCEDCLWLGEDRTITRRVPLGSDFIAYKHSPHWRWSVARRDGKQLPDLGTFTGFPQARDAITRYLATLETNAKPAKTPTAKQTKGTIFDEQQ